MEPIVRYRDVSKTYDGRVRVVDGLNLDVQQGEFLTMLGPSGSGKTTSLMMLAGFEAPTSGEILLEGRSLARLPPYRRDIGMVFQNYALFPHMSIADNIAFPLQIRKCPAAEIAQRVTQALEMVHLQHMEARRPGELSGGQQQRVALARALIFQPKIVLMDEPLGALDRQLREDMQLEIRSIHERLGVTVVYVTHDQGEALTMSDRIAIFNNGIIEQLATPEALYARPSNAFVARFVGENNMLPGSITQVNGAECAVEIAGIGPVVARVADVTRDQEKAIVAIRPEKIRIEAGMTAPQGINHFQALVEETVFFGDHTKLMLRLTGGQRLVVKASIEQTAVLGHAGQQLSVSWNAQDCTAFAVEAGSRARTAQSRSTETNLHAA